MNKSGISTVLSCLASIGVAATAVATAKVAPKASQILEVARLEKGDKLTAVETVKIAAPIYAPAIVTGVLTVTCIFSSNILNKRHQAAMTSAYALLNESYKKYKDKVQELYGEDADSRVTSEIVKDKYEECDELIPNGEQLFFDYNSMQYFTSTVDEVLQKVTMDDGLECYIISTPFDTTPALWDRF